MAFLKTRATNLATQAVNLEPQLVLEIEGVSTLFGVRKIMKLAEIGDEGLEIGDDWTIGGSIEVYDQEDIISLQSGTTTSIVQQLDPSKGLGSSISTMAVTLIDKDLIATKLVSPGFEITDILGARCKVQLGFQSTSYPEDYVPIFRGIVDDIQVMAGSVKLNLAHPDKKKQQSLFAKETLNVQVVEEYGPISFGTIQDRKIYKSLTSAANGLTGYFLYGDEYIKHSYNFTLQRFFLDRAQLGSAQNSQAIGVGTEMSTFYTLEGNVIDLALKLMLSSQVDSSAIPSSYVTVPIRSYNYVSPDLSYANAAFFQGIDLVEKYGVRVGDRVTATAVYADPSNPSSVSNPMGYGDLIFVKEIIQLFEGTVVVLETRRAGFLFNILTFEDALTATMSFISQYNVLGVGLGMRPDEVDIDEHLRIKRLFLSNFDVRFYLRDEENMKEFIEQELYAVAGAYSLPRKSKASVGMHIGPVPGANTSIISAADILNPKDLVVRRGLSANFMNSVVYKFDESLDGEDYESGEVTTNEDSLNRIKVGNRSFVVTARGLRASLNGRNLARAASQRRLNRYKFGAEWIDGVSITFGKGYAMEVGDLVLLDATGLSLYNSKDANRNAPPKFYEIINKVLDVKGTIRLNLVDTSYSTALRYGLVSPASKIKTGISQTQFVIEPSPGSQYGQNDYLKWLKVMPSGSTVGVKVRSPDATTRFFETTIKSVTSNTIEVTHPLGFVPQPGDWLEFADYDFEGTTALQRTLYGYMRSTPTFPFDGSPTYSML